MCSLINAYHTAAANSETAATQANGRPARTISSSQLGWREYPACGGSKREPPIGENRITENIRSDIMVFVTAGELLRTARRRHGLTQRQLATRARTSQAAISRIERDLVSPSVSTLAELLRLMNEELVLDAREVDWGHDVTLNRSNLSVPVAERIDRMGIYGTFVDQLAAAGRGG
jgi:transcriptional regulator with XRE-family HTH domain